MTQPQDVEPLIDALIVALAEKLPNYTVEGYEPDDTELAPHQIWVTDDAIDISEEYADMGASTSIVLPIYVTTILDVPKSREMQRAQRERRMNVIQIVQGVLRDFAGTLSVRMRPEGLLTRQSYIAAYIQLDVDILDLEAL